MCRGLDMCLLGARQLFPPRETIKWHSSFPRPNIFGVHPSGTPRTPYLLKKRPILDQNHPQNVPYGCAPKIFSLRSETLSIVHILYKNNHDRIKIAENRYFQGGLRFWTIKKIPYGNFFWWPPPSRNYLTPRYHLENTVFLRFRLYGEMMNALRPEFLCAFSGIEISGLWQKFLPFFC